MVYLTEFDIEHFDRMELKPDGWVKRDTRPMIEAYSRTGPTLTLMDNDRIICCGGVACGAWRGFGEFWLVPSIHVRAYMKSVFKNSRDFINDVIDKLDLYRVQATIREADTVAVGWIEHLGFERECLMRKFGPDGENHYLYARVK